MTEWTVENIGTLAGALENDLRDLRNLLLSWVRVGEQLLGTATGSVSVFPDFPTNGQASLEHVTEQTRRLLYPDAYPRSVPARALVWVKTPTGLVSAYADEVRQ